MTLPPVLRKRFGGTTLNIPEMTIPQDETPEPDQFCRECKSQLYRLVWNTKGDMLLCNNLWCQRYRQPQGFILVEGRMNMDDVVRIIKNKEKSKNAHAKWNVQRTQYSHRGSSQGTDKKRQPKTKRRLGPTPRYGQRFPAVEGPA